VLQSLNIFVLDGVQRSMPECGKQMNTKDHFLRRDAARFLAVCAVRMGWFASFNPQRG
jgi:hypothetical protein